MPGLKTELQRLDKEDEATKVRGESVVAPSVSIMSVVSDSVSLPLSLSLLWCFLILLCLDPPD